MVVTDVSVLNGRENILAQSHHLRKFLKRNKTTLVSRRCQKDKLNCQNWTTYANFVHMYSHTITEMIDSGVAIKLDTPVYMDGKGNV